MGSLGDWPRFLEGAGAGVLLRPLGEAANKTALLLLTGLAVAVAFRVGLFNVGAQGQLMVGALAAAVVGAKLELPAPLHVTAGLLAAAAAGGLYALGPALLKLHRGVHEVISTIMLNWVAVSLVENWLVAGPLCARALTGDLSMSGTDEVLSTARLPLLWGDGSRLNRGSRWQRCWPSSCGPSSRGCGAGSSGEWSDSMPTRRGPQASTCRACSSRRWGCREPARASRAPSWCSAPS